MVVHVKMVRRGGESVQCHLSKGLDGDQAFRHTTPGEYQAAQPKTHVLDGTLSSGNGHPFLRAISIIM